MRIVYISYFFPPIGGAGVQRTLKFVRYLPALGVSPTVLTGPVGSSGRWVPTDESLLGEMATAVQVVRIPGPEPGQTTGRRARADRWLRRPSAWARWWTSQVVVTGRTIERPDAVLATMSPFQTAEPAARLAHELGVPWVADLRDPWALDEMSTWPTALHRHLELRTMRRVLASAAAVVMNTAEAADAVRERFPELARTPVVAIPNGYDAEDFGGAHSERHDGAFRIVHTGYLHTDIGLEHRRRGHLRRALGGAAHGVDFLTRSHVVLLEALDRLRAQDPALAGRVQLTLAGVLSEVDRAVIGDAPNVECLGYLSHDDSLALLRSADLLFLPMHDLPTGRRATIVPGKTYEYLASGRPVLAAVPDGDARDLLLASPETAVVRPADAAGMAEAVARFVSRGKVADVARPGILRYERRALTAELADVLRTAAGRV